MRSYLFEVAGNPFAKQRARTLRTGRSYTPKETVMYENLVKTSFVSKYPDHIPTDKPCALCVLAVYPIPKSWSKKDKIKASEGILAPTKHDVDNVLKIISDGLNGVAWSDDKQVFAAYVKKKYGERPCVTVLWFDYDDEDMKEEGDRKLWQGLIQ